jgi:hypothetical protein
MPHSSKSAFAIVRFNFNAKKLRSRRGHGCYRWPSKRRSDHAEIQRVQESSDWVAGWRYFLEQTDLNPGMDPEEATRARQAHCEQRQSNHG